VEENRVGKMWTEVKGVLPTQPTTSSIQRGSQLNQDQDFTGKNIFQTSRNRNSRVTFGMYSRVNTPSFVLARFRIRHLVTMLAEFPIANQHTALPWHYCQNRPTLSPKDHQLQRSGQFHPRSFSAKKKCSSRASFCSSLQCSKYIYIGYFT